MLSLCLQGIRKRGEITWADAVLEEGEVGRGVVVGKVA